MEGATTDTQTVAGNIPILIFTENVIIIVGSFCLQFTGTECRQSFYFLK